MVLLLKGQASPLVGCTSVTDRRLYTISLRLQITENSCQQTTCSLGRRAIAFRTRQTRHLKVFSIFKVRGRKPASSPGLWRFIVGPGGPKHKSALDLVEEECLPKKQALILTRNPLQSCGYSGRVAQLGEHLLCKKAGKITQVPHLVSLTRKHAVQSPS
jgi:hypothetical protein